MEVVPETTHFEMRVLAVILEVLDMKKIEKPLIETYVLKKAVGVHETHFRIEFRPERINPFRTDTYFVTFALKTPLATVFTL